MTKVNLEDITLNTLIILGEDKNYPQGFRFGRSRDEYSMQPSGYSLFINKLPQNKTQGDSEDSLLVWNSDTGWLYKGPWCNVFDEWATDVITKHNERAKRYAALWDIELETGEE